MSIHCRMKTSAQPCVGNKQSSLSTLLKGTKSTKAVASARIEPTTVGLVIQRLNHWATDRSQTLIIVSDKEIDDGPISIVDHTLLSYMKSRLYFTLFAERFLFARLGTCSTRREPPYKTYIVKMVILLSYLIVQWKNFRVTFMATKSLLQRIQKRIKIASH